MHFMDGVAAEDRPRFCASCCEELDDFGVVPARCATCDGLRPSKDRERQEHAMDRLEVGSFSRALEAGLSFDVYRDARSGLS